MPRALQGAHDALLLRRVDFHEKIGARREVPERLVAQPGDGLAGEHGFVVEPDLLRHVGRHVAVVAGDHLHLHAVAAQLLQRLRRARLGRVRKAEEALQREALLVGQRHLVLIDAAGGQGEHAQAAFALSLHEAIEPGAPGGIECHRAFGCRHMAAAVEHLGDRAFHHHPARAVALVAGHDGETLAHEVVGNLVDLAPAGGAERARLAGPHECGIERVLDAGLEGGVEVGPPQHLRRGGALRVDGRGQRHLALGEGAGLVGAQHVHAAQVFDRLQPAHEHALRRELARAAREHHAHDGRQQLGREPHRQRHREEQRVDQRAAEPLVHRQHRDHHHEHHPQQHLAEAARAEREAGLRLAQPQARGQLAEHRALAGLRDEHRGRAAAHRAAEEDAVGPFAQGGTGGDGAGVFFHWKGLAGEARLGDEEVARVEHHAVGRHQVAGAQLHHVAGHQLACGQARGGAVAPGACGERKPLAQALHRLRGSQLLPEPERRAAAHDGEDGGRVGPAREQRRDHTADHEDQHQRARHLAQGQPPERDARAFVDGVGPVLLQACLCVGGGQAGAAAGVALQQLVGRQAPVGLLGGRRR